MARSGTDPGAESAVGAAVVVAPETRIEAGRARPI